MKSRKKPFFDGYTEPNTFIGGVGASSVTSAAALASKLSIERYHIKNFQIDANNNVSCYIGRNYTINGSAWSTDSIITYYLDLQGKCTRLNTFAFHNAFNPATRKMLIFPEVTSCVDRLVGGGGAGTRNKLGLICLPLLEPIGVSGTTNQNNFSWADFFNDVYVNSGNQTNNLGSPDADISSAISSNISTWIRYSTNENFPPVVTGLTYTARTDNAIDIIWDDVSHTNLIEHYLVFANGNFVGDAGSGTTFTITGLTAGQTYEIKMLAVDEMGNNSRKFSNSISVRTPNTFLGGVGNTSVTSAADFASITDLTLSEISDFQIDDNNNVSFYVSSTYQMGEGPACCGFDGDSSLKYFIDFEGRLTSMSVATIRSSGPQALYIPGITQINASQTRYCPVKYTFHENVTNLPGSFSIATTSGVKWVRLPSVLSIGAAALNGLSALDRCYIPDCTSWYYVSGNTNMWITTSSSSIKKIYVDVSQETANGGGLPDGLAQAQNVNGWNLVFITGYTAPNAVTNLSSSSVTSSGCNLNFTPPSSTHGLDFYEVWVENISLGRWELERVQDRYNAHQEISGSGSSITGLSSGSTYRIYIIACDIYWNRSASSNVIQITTS